MDMERSHIQKVNLMGCGSADCPWEYYTVSCRKMLNGSQGITELLMWEDLGENRFS
jgi:hypothetical protein